MHQFEKNSAKVTLRGASKHEASAEATLRAAKEERARRHLARAQPKAATALQAAWRGKRCRDELRQQLSAEWLQRYSAAVGQPNSSVSVQQLIAEVLPLVLFIYMPPPGRRRAVLQAGALWNLASGIDMTPLRGALALLLRSLADGAADNNLLAGAVTQPDARPALLGQLKRLSTLCCAVVRSADVLLQAAAARVLALLCDPAAWHGLQGHPEAQAWLFDGFLVWLASLPMLARAARRLLLALSTGSVEAQHAKQATAALGNLLMAQLHLAASGTSAAVKFLADELLTAPGLLRFTSPALLTRLAEPALFQQLVACAAAHAERMDGGAALHALGNLGGVLQRSLEGAAQAAMTMQFGAAAGPLLQRARTQGVGADPGALEATLQLFGDGGFAASLLAALPLPQMCALYSLLLELCGGGADSSRSSAMRVLNPLAFSPLFLPQLWRWLALGIGLPLEVSPHATKFDIPSLAQGAQGIPSHQAKPFRLFCLAHAHFLGAVDDLDFHETQALFSLPQHRAIAAALNTLVFRTQLPAPSNPSTPRGPGPMGDDTLLQAAPRLLRALYERDARRAFCRPQLWLEPYHRLAAGGGVDVSGAAVLRALLHSQQGAEVEGSSSAPGPQSPRPRPPPTPPSPVHPAASAASGLAALLLQAPQCIPFDERVAVFRGLVALDKQARRYGMAPVEGGPRPARVLIRRTRLLEDALAQLMPLGGALRGPLSIEFVDARGMVEAGIDMGGLTKELLEAVGTAVFDPDRCLFTAAADGSRYPHPAATAQPRGTELLTLAGAILGKALYEGVLLAAPLAPFFVARLQGRLPTLDDLAALDPGVHRGLISLKRHPGDAGDLALYFSVEAEPMFGGARAAVDLIPGGQATPVTNANKLLYVHLVADWHLRRGLGAGAAAFGAGLARVLPPPWLRLFSPGEVNQLLGGGEGADLDLEDMRRYTQYGGGYSPSSRTVGLFWRVVAGLAPADRAALLRFATSCGRAPLGGFAHLKPPLTIYKVDCGASPLALLGGADVQRLPTASTCANTLKLPNYRRAETLREKLLAAVRSGAGFDLS